MNHLLKAMGFWIWGLVAIGLSISLLTVSYRMLSVYRTHADSDPAGAKQALAKLKSLPNVSPRVLKLWNLYADTIPVRVSEPL